MTCGSSSSPVRRKFDRYRSTAWSTRAGAKWKAKLKGSPSIPASCALNVEDPSSHTWGR